MIGQQMQHEQQEEGRAVQHNRMTEVKQHSTTSWHNKRTRGRCNKIRQQRCATRNNQLAQLEDKRVAQDSMVTDAT